MTGYSDEQIEADLAALEFRRLNPGNVAGEDWTHISARLSAAVPSLLARAQKAEAEAQNNLRAYQWLRAELAEAKAERDRFRAEVEHLNGDDLSRMLAQYADDPEWQKHYLASHLAFEVAAERNRLAAQVAAVRAVLTRWHPPSGVESASLADLHRQVRAALDGTEQDEAKRRPTEGGEQ